MKIITAILLALSTIACNTDNDDLDIIIEPIDTPTEIPQVPPTDLQWQYAYKPHISAGENFIASYINPKEFTAFYVLIKYDPRKLETIIGGGLATLRELNLSAEKGYSTEEVGMQFFPTYEAPAGDGMFPRTDNVIDKKSQFFEALAKAHRDVDYNDNFYDMVPYLFRPTRYINITCNADYDAAHPTGATLNDITEINYYSALPFIDTKYKNRRLGDFEQTRTQELLTSFNARHINLLRSDMTFRLITPPSKKGSYQFALTYCNKDGATLSATTVPINLLPN